MIKKVYILLIIGLLFIFIGAVSAQGTLQFNQVKLVNSTVETVPSGKVWKITGILPTVDFRYTSSVGTGPYMYYIVVNGNSRSVGHGPYLNYYSSGATHDGSVYVQDIWLPAGTTLAAGTNVGEVSVIEFNIVP